MNEQQKNEANKSSSTTGTSNQNSGSGSDTLSAAKISAGTSVGNVGQSPMPQGGSGAGSSGGTSAQSSTLASHTSKPMGGTGGTGASTHASSGSGGGQSGSSQGGRSSGGSQGGMSAGGQGGQGGQSRGGQSSGQSQGGMMDQAKNMAGQATETAGEVYEQASEWARDTYEQASEWASDAYSQGSRHFNRVGGRSMRGVRTAGTGVQRYVAENPVMVGLIGLAAGLLIGALLPRTRREDEAFGEWADEVREQGLRYAHEMAQRGREYVEESFSGDDPRFAQHESEFRSGGRGAPNRH